MAQRHGAGFGEIALVTCVDFFITFLVVIRRPKSGSRLMVDRVWVQARRVVVASIAGHPSSQIGPDAH